MLERPGGVEMYARFSVDPGCTITFGLLSPFDPPSHEGHFRFLILPPLASLFLTGSSRTMDSIPRSLDRSRWTCSWVSDAAKYQVPHSLGKTWTPPGGANSVNAAKIPSARTWFLQAVGSGQMI